MITTAFLSQYHLSAKKVEQYLIKHELGKYGSPSSSDSQNEYVYYQGETLCLFYRQYASPNISWINFNEIEQTIIHCIYTRHHDGFVRQKHLNLLTDTKYPDIAVPFVIRLLGEYVLEIQLDTAPFIQRHPKIIADFIQQNPVFWQRQKSRMASYWDIYYRSMHATANQKFRIIENWKYYPARQLLLDIDNLVKSKSQTMN
ncbi:hypothetical protein [Psychrobacter sp. I-STPA10]|uniref:hypothetical protein n=1 Tax=Psychrobacter sp. I-STPA10 TaxID=2585769 RepID=UPI001E2C9654|nr:hypothetical protein [Psychrobacter sp. I-STPA10]